jgi:hypothetical protein
MELDPRQFEDGGVVGEAVDGLRRRLFRRSSDRVLCDFLEDDLVQARDAMEGIGAYLDGLVETLGDCDSTPEQLFERADDPSPLDQIDQLSVTLSNLRRRLALVAGRSRLSKAAPLSRLR